MNALQVAERRAVYALQTAAPSFTGEAFNLMASAPQSVAKLRELILSLAVRGRLAPQNAKDGSAALLLERIDAEYKRLVTPGKVKRRKQLPPIPSDAAPFIVPDSWTWTRIGALGGVVGGGTPNSHDSTLWAAGNEIPWLTPADLYGLRNKQVSRGRRDITAAGLASSSAQLVPSGTVLFSSRAPIGYVAIAANPLATNQGFKSCVPYLPELGDYLYWYLKQARKAIDDAASGTTFKEISGSKFAEVAVPLPPLAEQHRIVARVEELMGLCDELETHGRLQDEQHARLASTLFDALVASASSAELAANWQRVASHFDLLLDRSEAIDALEQTILQLAVRGLLVPQDPADEPAARILQAIRSARAKRGVSSAGKRYFATRGEPCFKLPTGWEAVGLSDLCTVGGGATPSKNNPDYWGGEVPWVSPKDMKVDEIGDSQDHVTAKALCETCLPLVAKRSLLIVVRGMILAHSFPVAVTRREVALNQDMKSLTPKVDGLSAFLALVLKGFTPEILSLVGRSTHGTCKLESDKLFGFAFGLPPLAEQHRIVARVEALRGLCVDLRQRLQKARATQSNLANALAAQAIA